MLAVEKEQIGHWYVLLLCSLRIVRPCVRSACMGGGTALGMYGPTGSKCIFIVLENAMTSRVCQMHSAHMENSKAVPSGQSMPCWP